MRDVWMLMTLILMLAMTTALVSACGGDDDDDDDDAVDDDDADDDADDDSGECTPEATCEFAVGCGGFADVDQCLDFSSSYDDETCSPGYEDCVCGCYTDGLASGDCGEYQACGTACFTDFC